MLEPVGVQENRDSSFGRPVRVMFFEHAFGVGGAERILRNLLESFDRSRVQPSLVILTSPGKMMDQLKVDDIPVYHSLAKGRFDPHLLPALMKVIRKERPDVIYTCNYPVTMFFGRLAGMLCGVSTVVVALHSIGYMTRSKWRTLSLKLFSPFIRRMVAVSEGQKTYYVRTHGIKKSKIEVIFGAVDLSRFKQDVVPASLKVDFGIPEHARIVGILAAMRPEKRHDLFLRMAEEVLSRRQDVYFILAGDGPERASLEVMADEGKLRPYIQFLGNRSDVPPILKSLDICMLTSDPVVETFPQCLLEAMASGLPVVSTDVGSINEMVIEGVTGFLVPPGDVNALAERTLQLIDNPNKAREMGQAGRRRVEELFSLEIMVKRFEDMFERLVLEGKGR